MPVNLNTLFQRLGSVIYTVGNLVETDSVNYYRGVTLPNRTNTLQGFYTSSDQNLIDGLYATLSSAQAAPGSFSRSMVTIAQNTVTQMVNEVNGSTNSLVQALQFIITQMIGTADSVQANAVGSSVTPGSNTGNGIVVVGTKSALGAALELLFAETITATVTRDSQSGGASAGQESLQFVGQTLQSDPLSYLYPDGSGANATLRAISGASFNNSGTQNFLKNSNFETFSSGTAPNTPDNWHITTGSDGGTILKSTSVKYDGAAAISFAGNGSELTGIKTQFGTDFSANIAPLTAYVVNLWTRVDTTPGAGVLEVALIDGSNAIINDASGNPASITIALTGVSTSWLPLSGFLRTPRVLPSSVYLRIRLSTALTSGHTVYIDRCALAQPTQLYTGGPLIGVFSGSTNFIQGDSFSLAISNNYGGLIQSGCDRLFSMRTNGLLLPSSNSPTISDSLVA
jgi:hypothetical protein